MSKMMRFVSTRGKEKVTGAEAIVNGFAADGGLFVPCEFPTLTWEKLEELAQLDYILTETPAQ